MLRSATVKHSRHAVLFLLGVLLVVSCATSPSPSSELAVTVPAVTTSTSTSTPVEASAGPPMVVSPLQTPTPVPVSPTATRATLEVSPVHPTVVSPLQTPIPALPLPVCTVRVVRTFPHDRSAFTQGLVFDNGVLYEGTGLWGQSTLRRVDLESGEVLQLYSLPPEYFGEGITIWQDRIIQLTWKSGQGLVYDRESFELLDTFRYPTEGWGITHDGTRLIMSDGTQTLRFWDPETRAEIGSVDVYANAAPVTQLNELEYVQGMVLANVWQTDLIAVIDPQAGQVTAWLDLRGLLEPGEYAEPVDVLNGIAYDAGSQRLFVTGKLWPKLFEIEVLSPTGAPAPLTCK